eukprot:scaffold63258_cov59-Phaeocystis_antarctica.AAC.4
MRRPSNEGRRVSRRVRAPPRRAAAAAESPLSPWRRDERMCSRPRPPRSARTAPRQPARARATDTCGRAASGDAVAICATGLVRAGVRVRVGVRVTCAKGLGGASFVSSSESAITSE